MTMFNGKNSNPQIHPIELYYWSYIFEYVFYVAAVAIKVYMRRRKKAGTLERLASKGHELESTGNV